MPVVKTLKYDIHGDGEVTKIKVSIDSKGEFSADVPMFVRMIGGSCVSRESSMLVACQKVETLIRAYQQSKTTVEKVILVDFEKHQTPFLNQGIGFSMNYIVANKYVRGEYKRYQVLSSDFGGGVREIGNTVPSYSPYSSKGVALGKCIELQYTDELMASIIDIETRLIELCEKLSGILGSSHSLLSFAKESFLMLVSNDQNKQSTI